MAPVLTPPARELRPPPSAAELELGVIRDARRRQRRRRFVMAVVAAAAIGGYVASRETDGSVPRSVSLLSRPLHLPSLGPRGRCPVSSGYMLSNAYFGGSAMGAGPVRVLLADAGDIRHGRVDLGRSDAPHWFALQTLWFAMPGYDGPFIVRGGRVGRRGSVDVQPDAGGLGPGAGPLVVEAGPTINTQGGYRTLPGSTWVRSPGCFAWQVDGRGFSEVVVVDALAPGNID